MRAAPLVSSLALAAACTGQIGGDPGGADDAARADAADQIDAPRADAGAPVDAPAIAADAHPAGCDYEKIVDEPGVVLDVVDGDSVWEARPLAAGEGFACLRLAFTMDTADTLEETNAAYEGCPIFTAIATVRGADRALGSGLFKMWRVGCIPGPPRIEIDSWVGSNVVQGPWALGETYRIEIEVVPFTSTMRLYQNGAQVGPAVSAPIDGTTVAMTAGGHVALGQKQPAAGAFFPNYGATYRDVEVWADIVPDAAP